MNEAQESHYQTQIERLTQQIEDMQTAYAAGDRESQMRGWAIDRSIEAVKAGCHVGCIFAYADRLLEYTSKPQKDAEQSVNDMLVKGAA